MHTSFPFYLLYFLHHPFTSLPLLKPPDPGGQSSGKPNTKTSVGRPFIYVLRSSLPPLPCLLCMPSPILHLSWGCGFLKICSIHVSSPSQSWGIMKAAKPLAQDYPAFMGTA